MFGYPCHEPQDVFEFFQDIANLIVLVKDVNGDDYWPEYGFNGMGDLLHLEGYKIKLIEEVFDFDLCEGVSLPEIEGCTDCGSPNFDVWATVDDGSCEPLQIGDTIAGGIVFYLDESLEHGLIAAFEDAGSYEWGYYNDYLNGADEAGLGFGLQSTLDIISDCTESNIAASICYNYESEGYNDWYLPSLDELELMHQYIGQIADLGNVGGFQNSHYWSSTEHDDLQAYVYVFNYSYSDDHFKSSSRLVRPIRSF